MKTKPLISLCALISATSIALAMASKPPHDHDHDHDHGKPTTAPAKPHADHHDHGDAHADEVKLTSDAIARYGIKVAAISKQPLSRVFSAPARVSFNTEVMAHVGSAVRGRATEIKVRVGDDVKKGDELVVVESPELGEAQSDFLQKRTTVTVAESAVEPAREALDRARKLYEQNQGIALGEVQKRTADVKAAEGALQTAQAAATAAENTLRLLGMDQPAVETLGKSLDINPRYAVRAPIDGQVIDREVTLGELVSPEKESLLVLANVNSLWVIADVPEARLKDVRKNAKATVRISAHSDDAVMGTVAFIAPSLNPNTRTALVRIEIENAKRDLRPGMFATVEITSSADGAAAAVLVVPADAVQTVEGSPAVFVPVEGEENTFAKRAISVGPAVGGLVPVMSGLKEGDRIVVAGTFILKAELGKGGATHEH